MKFKEMIRSPLKSQYLNMEVYSVALGLGFEPYMELSIVVLLFFSFFKFLQVFFNTF